MALLVLALPACARLARRAEIARACRATASARWPAWQLPTVESALRVWAEPYPRDGIHAYCFEKAGATYIFSNGVFTSIVDD